jgi:hypothetical protein
MPTPQPRRTSTGRTRTTSSSRGRYSRSAATPRRSVPSIGLRRRQPSPTGVKKVTAAAGKAVPSSGKGKAGGAALIATAAAAAGVALKNKDKLLGKVKQQPDQHADDPAINAATPPTPVN